MDAAVANDISMDALHLRCQSATTDVVAALAERHDVRWGCIEALDNRNRKLSVWSTHTLKKCKTSERDTNGEKKPGCKKIYYLCEREKGRADPPGGGRGEGRGRKRERWGQKKTPRRASFLFFFAAVALFEVCELGVLW